MPLSKYFDKPGNKKPGKGAKVMADMRARYGAKRGEEVFYATVNKMRKGSAAQRRAQPHRPSGRTLVRAHKKAMRK